MTGHARWNIAKTYYSFDGHEWKKWGDRAKQWSLRFMLMWLKYVPFASPRTRCFKFLNNKSIEQPRYKCLGCSKYFTHNPNSRGRKHPQGYTKAAQNKRPVSQVQDLHDNAIVICPHPECGKVGASKFLYYNNGKLTQPRYKCGACKTSFTQGGRLRLQRKSEVDAVYTLGNVAEARQSSANLGCWEIPTRKQDCPLEKESLMTRVMKVKRRLVRTKWLGCTRCVRWIENAASWSSWPLKMRIQMKRNARRRLNLSISSSNPAIGVSHQARRFTKSSRMGDCGNTNVKIVEDTWSLMERLKLSCQLLDKVKTQDTTWDVWQQQLIK